MKYRGSSKIKRRHHLIDGLDLLLQSIEKFPEVSSITPGIITLCRHNDRLKFTIQTTLLHGLRCLARSHGAVQEVFLVSTDVPLLTEKITILLTNQ
jgi:hypothetical protein